MARSAEPTVSKKIFQGPEKAMICCVFIDIVIVELSLMRIGACSRVGSLKKHRIFRKEIVSRKMLTIFSVKFAQAFWERRKRIFIDSSELSFLE